MTINTVTNLQRNKDELARIIEGGAFDASPLEFSRQKAIKELKELIRIAEETVNVS